MNTHRQGNLLVVVHRRDKVDAFDHFLNSPHAERTFDKGRKLTTLEHHLSDYQNQVTILDDSHWQEIRETVIRNKIQIKTKRYINPDGNLWNFEFLAQQDCLHYHV